MQCQSFWACWITTPSLGCMYAWYHTQSNQTTLLFSHIVSYSPFNTSPPRVRFHAFNAIFVSLLTCWYFSMLVHRHKEGTRISMFGSKETANASPRRRLDNYKYSNGKYLKTTLISIFASPKKFNQILLKIKKVETIFLCYYNSNSKKILLQ